MDETTVRLLAVLSKCWMKRGTQKRVPTPGSPQWFHLFGAYNWRTDQVITLPAAHKNSASFAQFIQLLLGQLPDDKPIVLVMDNASYHHSRRSEALLAFYENQMTVCWLPPYCSKLNPIERFWRHLKDKACANRLFRSTAELIDSVDKVLCIQNEMAHSDRFLFTKTFF